MADGSSKPIQDVHVGDQITNKDPATGKVQTHAVIATHITDDDHDFVDLTVQTPSGSSTITVTAHHLFWDSTEHSWTAAEDLKPGDRLDTLGTDLGTVAVVHPYFGGVRTYDLSVDSVHTFFVLAWTEPVLVHNCPDGEPDVLYRSPATGNKESERSGLNPNNHGGDHPTAYYASRPEGAAQYAGNGHELGFWRYVMKPGFREAFGDREFPLLNKNGIDVMEWRIPAGRAEEFNSYIDHELTEWWDSALGSFFPPP
jgi:hypothetical protein